MMREGQLESTRRRAIKGHMGKTNSSGKKLKRKAEDAIDDVAANPWTSVGVASGIV
jgi:ElaB/YqjD/DUF883 family membrane-anchored ribosome-binding protein